VLAAHCRAACIALARQRRERRGNAAAGRWSAPHALLTVAPPFLHPAAQRILADIQAGESWLAADDAGSADWWEAGASGGASAGRGPLSDLTNAARPEDDLEGVVAAVMAKASRALAARRPAGAAAAAPARRGPSVLQRLGVPLLPEAPAAAAPPLAALKTRRAGVDASAALELRFTMQHLLSAADEAVRGARATLAAPAQPTQPAASASSAAAPAAAAAPAPRAVAAAAGAAAAAAAAASSRFGWGSLASGYEATVESSSARLREAYTAAHEAELARFAPVVAWRTRRVLRAWAGAASAAGTGRRSLLAAALDARGRRLAAAALGAWREAAAAGAADHAERLIAAAEGFKREKVAAQFHRLYVLHSTLTGWAAAARACAQERAASEAAASAAVAANAAAAARELAAARFYVAFRLHRCFGAWRAAWQAARQLRGLLQRGAPGDDGGDAERRARAQRLLARVASQQAGAQLAFPPRPPAEQPAAAAAATVAAEPAGPLGRLKGRRAAARSGVAPWESASAEGFDGIASTGAAVPPPAAQPRGILRRASDAGHAAAPTAPPAPRLDRRASFSNGGSREDDRAAAAPPADGAAAEEEELRASCRSASPPATSGPPDGGLADAADTSRSPSVDAGDTAGPRARASPSAASPSPPPMADAGTAAEAAASTSAPSAAPPPVYDAAAVAARAEKLRAVERGLQRREAAVLTALARAIGQRQRSLAGMHYARSLLRRWGLRPLAALVAGDARRACAAAAHDDRRRLRAGLAGFSAAVTARRWAISVRHAAAWSVLRGAGHAALQRRCLRALSLWALAARADRRRLAGAALRARPQHKRGAGRGGRRARVARAAVAGRRVPRLARPRRAWRLRAAAGSA